MATENKAADPTSSSDDELRVPQASRMSRKPEDESFALFRFPKAVYFMFGNEFCERFSYYGMRALLTIYLHQTHHLPEYVCMHDYRSCTVTFNLYSCGIYCSVVYPFF